MKFSQEMIQSIKKNPYYFKKWLHEIKFNCTECKLKLNHFHEEGRRLLKSIFKNKYLNHKEQYK